MKKVILNAVMWFGMIMIFISFGMERKGVFEMTWDIIAWAVGGGVVGFGYWFIFGCLGVCGAFCFGLGPILLTLIGITSFGGVGSFVHALGNLIEDPSYYNYDYWVLAYCLVFGFICQSWGWIYLRDKSAPASTGITKTVEVVGRSGFKGLKHLAFLSLLLITELYVIGSFDMGTTAIFATLLIPITLYGVMIGRGISK